MKGIFITGTDTNVGKTYIACQIAAELKSRNINVIPRKPVETGCKLINGLLHPNDADLLLKASGSNITLDEVCPNRFSPAISPQIAASHAGKLITLNQLVDSCTNSISQQNFLLVEGAGGFYSPICNQSTNADLAKELNLPVILVVEDKLGAVNQALLAVCAIDKYQLEINAIVLNKCSSSSQNKLIDNVLEIKKFINYPVYKTHYKQNINPEFYSQLLSRL